MEGDLGWHCSSNNWDLHAVVRSACSGGGRVAPSPASDGGSFSWLPPPQPQKDELADAAACQPLPADPAAVDDLCLEDFCASPKPETPQPSSPGNEELPEQQPPAKPRTSGRGGGGGPTRSKRKSKKSQVNKEVTRVPASAPSPDLWAWRKYGQKPIKGSPYPRGYYRCSTDKDCKARKQVERCRTDPTTLIVTYTGEHSHPVPLHRNSLAGTTRNKPQPPSYSPAGEPPQPQAAQSPSATDTKTQGSPSASAGLSPATPLRSPSVGVDYEDEEDDDTVAVRMLLEDVDVAAEDDALLFLRLDEPAPGPGNGCEDLMLFPKPDDPAPGLGNDVMLFSTPHEPAPGPGNGGSGCDDVMLFPKPVEPAPTTSSSRMNSGVETVSVTNIAEEKFSVSGLSAWEATVAAAAAESSWGC